MAENAGKKILRSRLSVHFTKRKGGRERVPNRWRQADMKKGLGQGRKGAFAASTKRLGDPHLKKSMGAVLLRPGRGTSSHEIAPSKTGKGEGRSGKACRGRGLHHGEGEKKSWSRGQRVNSYLLHYWHHEGTETPKKKKKKTPRTPPHKKQTPTQNPPLPRSSVPV